MRQGQGALPTAAAVVTAAAVTLAGCGGDDDKAAALPTPTPSASSSPPIPPSPDPTEAAKTQILDAYKKFGDVSDEVSAVGRVGTQDVKPFLVDQAAVKWAAAGLNMEKNGTKLAGLPHREATVTALDLRAAPPTANITACLDTTGVKLVKADTGEPVATRPQAARYVQTATAQQRDGHWVITDFVSEHAEASHRGQHRRDHRRGGPPHRCACGTR